MKLKLYNQYFMLGALFAVPSLLISGCSPTEGQAKPSVTSQGEPTVAQEQKGSQDRAQDEPIETVRDFSDFDKFEYQWVNDPDCGGEPYRNQGIHEATIQRQSDGTLTFDFILVQEASSGQEECTAELRADTTTGTVCLEVIQPRQRTLTDNEAVLVLETFSDVKITQHSDDYEGPVCEQVCDWDLYSWDTESHTWDACVCWDVCMDHKKAEEIDKLVTELGSEAHASESLRSH